MEFGVSTLLFFEAVGIEKHFECLADRGVGCIEIRSVENHLPHQDPQAVPAMRTALRVSGLRLHSIHLPGDIINALHVTESAHRRAAIGGAVRIAETLAQLNGRMLICHPGGLVENSETRTDSFHAAQEGVAELASVCKVLGVRLALENALPTKPRLGAEIEELLEFAGPLDPATVGFCLDTSHANLSSVDPTTALRMLGERVITLHLSDNDGATDLHAAPFTGTVDWGAFMPELARLDYDGPLMFEVRKNGSLPEHLAGLRSTFEQLTELATP